MKRSQRNLLVLLNNEFMSEQAIEQQVDSLHEILVAIETDDAFCTAHELVNRNRITSKPAKIIKESKHFRLRPFRFLINKN